MTRGELARSIARGTVAARPWSSTCVACGQAIPCGAARTFAPLVGAACLPCSTAAAAAVAAERRELEAARRAEGCRL